MCETQEIMKTTFSVKNKMREKICILLEVSHNYALHRVCWVLFLHLQASHTSISEHLVDKIYTANIMMQLATNALFQQVYFYKNQGLKIYKWLFGMY